MFAALRCRRRFVGILAVVVASLVLAPTMVAAHGDDGAYESDEYDWWPITLGSGAAITDLAIADDGVLVAATTTFGAYTRLPNGPMWEQLVSPKGFAPELRDTVPALPAAVAIAPSDATRIYVGWAGQVLISSDGGVTFERTDFSATAPSSRLELAVDPAHPDTVAATPRVGSLRISHDGGLTWQRAATTGRLTDVTFDRTSAPTAGGWSSVVYAVGPGRGVYRSTDGGNRWARLGGPKDVAATALGSDGVLWAITGTTSGPATLVRYDGAWTDVTPPAWTPEQRASGRPLLTSLPNVAGGVVAGDDEQLFVTRTAAAEWTAITWTEALGDLPRGEPANNQNLALAASDLVADPAVAGRLWLATDIGVQYGDLAEGATSVVWTDRSRGLEGRAALDVVTTRFGAPLFAVGGFGPYSGLRDLADPARTPGFTTLTTSSLDAPSGNTSFVVAAAIGNTAPFATTGMYSSNAGTTWRTFRTQPRGDTTAAEFGYGQIAAASPRNLVWAPGVGPLTTSGDLQPYFTTDQGRTWSPVVLPGVDDWNVDITSVAPIGLAPVGLTADRSIADGFYLHVPDIGVYRSDDGGVTWQATRVGSLVPGLPDTTGVLESVPGRRNELLFVPDDDTLPLLRSGDRGATWEPVPGVDHVAAIGFGADPHSATGVSAASVFLAGEVEGEAGIWRSDDDADTWIRIGDVPGSLDAVTTISGNARTPGLVYVGLAGSSFVAGVPIPVAE